MTVDRVDVNGVEIAYETFGRAGDPPLLMIMGLGSQMLYWPEQFCRALAEQGLYVIRFDNRDVGLSAHLDSLPAPSPVAVALHRRPPAYRLDDLAADTIGLIDALGLASVHLLGASMGGFIAQLVTSSAPGRVASVSLMMTSTGSRLVGRPKADVLSSLLRRRPAASVAEAVEQSVAMLRMIASPGYPFEEGAVREVVEQCYARGLDPRGQLRQFGAVIAQRDRSAALARIQVPTVVMHGLADRLIDVSGGLAVARAVPAARFVGYRGMGHDLPAALWPEFVAEITATVRRGAAARPIAEPD